ncbi:hypothetical protein QJS04_geneDACA011771 [Acorus gramineus]|uniref:Prephenate/arogenate dehydrogenase domain-containing protein n=1 Tax=Acorus gramineus TaxID=55184 RepID=A0AAV9BJY9_ACOGR|nr:hypothetical protein QJS04_geneDACA011771 [Acorus gramineus]
MLKLPSLQPQTLPLAKPHQTLNPIKPTNLPLKSNPLNQFPTLRRLRIRATDDAAYPLDHDEAAAAMKTTFVPPHTPSTTKLKIAVVGFGNFGQFLTRTLVRQGHTVLVQSRSDHSASAAALGAAAFYADPGDLCDSRPDVVLLSTSILSTESVLRSLPLHRLRRDTLFVDVLSVKESPKNLFLEALPPEFDILCTHPMFGPESGKDGWADLPFVYEKVRIARGETCEGFLEIFRSEGCQMVEMSCAEHDRQAAETQFLTHTVGRVLGMLGLRSTPIDTKGYKSLLELVENTAGDSFDLYYGLYMHNDNATLQFERLDAAFGVLRRELELHGKYRKQVLENASGEEGELFR